ncbi:hypothetical protein [Haemophilus influenzae]|nr:hypothetical protein [Haemophilus influenzae]
MTVQSVCPSRSKIGRMLRLKAVFVKFYQKTMATFRPYLKN